MPSGRLGLLPPPLAGEGWGGGELAQMKRFVCRPDLVACPLPIPPPQSGEGWGGGTKARLVMSKLPKTPRWHVSTKQRVRARSLRANSTDAERMMWSALRAHRTNRASFRRQTPIGPYIVDFVFYAAR